MLSCDDDGGSNDTKEEIVPALLATPSSLNFGQDGSTASISITSNTVWTISSNASWCVSTLQTSKGNASIKINAEANDAEEERSATVTISASGLLPFYWDTGGALDRSNYTVKDRRSLDTLMAGAE
ncbi:BACON domain-containing protein [Labilibaculum sp. K2S]|uniref:BACON domain-containing protein n=1 Tax=Labilibaculum sp. K2S TaxID=3056386 RepID=UPI0025A32666|nr:BACON domain-containing protein [Labilibaculum sp. K2S]MDM8159336.1 BACON domain-containing protein [Labilibaculum sp. K2S]